MALRDISKISRKNGVLTMTGVEEYVKKGISVSLAIENNKPRIVVNLGSIKAEGRALSSNILRLCKIIK